MAEISELRRLLSLVQYDSRLDCIDGLTVFRNLLERDADGSVLKFLQQEWSGLEGKRRSGIACALAEHYRRTGQLRELEVLFADNGEDAEVKTSVLNALWDQPGSSPDMGPGIVRLAIAAANHSSPDVRAEACSVIQNQCGWKVDVSSAVDPLYQLLSDDSDRVRSQAACAVGNLAKKKYDLSRHVILLARNLGRDDISVRNYSAWALWQLSRSKHDIGTAVQELLQLLADDGDWSDPRKNAAGALLHHAKKSRDNQDQVLLSLRQAGLHSKHREVRQLLDELDNAGGEN